MDELKLLPCPHCGGVARVHTGNSEKYFYVACTNIYTCGAKQYWFDNEEEAITAWNRRYDPEEDDRK